MIPPLDDGVLPEGIHDCDIQEIAAIFGRFQRSDRRVRLTERLEEYLKEARASGILVAVVIDGSYVSGKEEPADIDLLAVLKSDWDPARELKPFQYNVISKSAVRAAKCPFDLFAVPEGSQRYNELVARFAQTNPDKHGAFTKRTRKGMLRVAL